MGLNIVPLKDLCNDYKKDIVDGPFGANLKREHYKDEGIPVLKIQNIKSFNITLKKMDYVDEEKFYELRRHNYLSGDIVMTKLGNPLGESAIVEGIDEGLIVADLVRIRAQKIDTKYLCYHLNSPVTSAYINSQQKGTTRPRVRIAVVRDLPIYAPPIPEQQRIVAILDQAFADIEKARANAEKNLKNARELFDSYLTRIFSQSGEENQDMMGGWKTGKLSNLGITQTGSTPKTTVKENFGSAIPFVKPADFQPNGLIDYNNDGLSEKGLAESRLVKQGSVLMVCIGATIGKVGYTSVNVTTNQQINSFTPYQGMLTKYCYYAMLNKEFHRQVIYNASQATLPIINKSKWSSLEIKYPSSILEQQRIIDSLDKLSDKVKQLKKSYQYKLDSLEELKKSLLQKAFSGELTKSKGIAA